MTTAKGGRSRKPKVHLRQAVVDYIQRKLPEDATLPEIIEALCELRLKSMGAYHREWLEELGQEVSAEELVRGERLPAVPTLEEMVQLPAGCAWAS